MDYQARVYYGGEHRRDPSPFAQYKRPDWRTRRHVEQQPVSIVAVFGTRPEIIKLAPVFRALADDTRIRTNLVSTGQQRDLLPVFLDDFGIRIDESLGTMVPGRSLNESLATMISALDGVFGRTAPNLVVVQGDTSTALAGALAARFRGVPVAHVEAGLRTGNPDRPFPEESNRTLISRIASLHFAPTAGNRENLIAEGIPRSSIIVSGNPVIDALAAIEAKKPSSEQLSELLTRFDGKKLVVLTIHRRENFGSRLGAYIEVVLEFLDHHADCAVVVPVHPNPMAHDPVIAGFSGVARVALVEPLPYADFIGLLRNAWLVLSDSGGIQEEVVTLGTPLLILRTETERPEALASGTARLAATATALATELETAIAPGSWLETVSPHDNPFGDGQSGIRIARAISDFVRGQVATMTGDYT